jgi:hypothetical protein
MFIIRFLIGLKNFLVYLVKELKKDVNSLLDHIEYIWEKADNHVIAFLNTLDLMLEEFKRYERGKTHIIIFIRWSLIVFILKFFCGEPDIYPPDLILTLWDYVPPFYSFIYYIAYAHWYYRIYAYVYDKFKKRK